MIRLSTNIEHRPNQRPKVRQGLERRRYCVSLILLIVLAVCSFATPSVVANVERESAEGASVTILVYHRFGPVVADSMTVRTSVFAAQLQSLHDNGYTVVPLREIVNFLTGHGELPPRAVAITADDGHRSVFSDMKPLLLPIRGRAKTHGDRRPCTSFPLKRRGQTVRLVNAQPFQTRRGRLCAGVVDANVSFERGAQGWLCLVSSESS